MPAGCLAESDVRQDIVKSLFGDANFNTTHRLGAVNSINWARILAQTVYYFLSYFHIQSQLPSGVDADEIEIQYVVPTGNFGDILAGYYAKRMGLPMGKLVVATNANDILARFWNTGKYEKVDSAHDQSTSDGKQGTSSSGVKETLSPAMDILVSSNFERLLWYLAYENAGAEDANQQDAACETLAGWMSKMKSDGRVAIPVAVLETARRDFLAERISDEQVRILSSTQSTSLTFRPDPSDDPVTLRREPILCSRSPYCSWFGRRTNHCLPSVCIFSLELGARSNNSLDRPQHIK
jgi:threonine synthase